jgi:hypothetical protein
MDIDELAIGRTVHWMWQPRGSSYAIPVDAVIVEVGPLVHIQVCPAAAALAAVDACWVTRDEFTLRREVRREDLDDA